MIYDFSLENNFNYDFIADTCCHILDGIAKVKHENT